MITIEQVKKLIPEDALNSFYDIFEPSVVNKILLSFRTKKNTCFRINTLKTDKSKVVNSLRNKKINIKNLNYSDCAFITDKECDNLLLKTDLAVEGLIYLQSISSQLPPLILKPLQNDKILDISASPGSKTSQMAAIMNNTGMIDAVELDFIRTERLKHNLSLLGVSNTNVFNDDGANFCKDKLNFYDKALVDVPCSGEGRFNYYDKNSYCKWRSNGVEKLTNLQKKLLKSAVRSVKPGGTIVYSTCTLNVFENESVINDLLSDNEFKIEILPIDEIFLNFNERIKPILKYKDKVFNKDISRSLRIIQSENIEGFFICKIKKIS